MSNLILIVALLGFAVVLLVLLRIGLLPHRRISVIDAMPVKEADRGLAERILRALRARNLSALILGVIGVVAAVLIHQAFITSGGLGLVAAPAGIWVLVVLVLLCWPIPFEASERQRGEKGPASASLVPRTTRMFGPAWGLVVPIVLFSVALVGILGAGVLSSVDDRGRYRQIDYQTVTSSVVDGNMIVTDNLVGQASAGPFPGWYYTVPVVVLLVAGLGLTLFALFGNARRPSLRNPGLAEFDHVVRTHNGYVLSSGFSAFLCLQMVPLLSMAATVVYTMASNHIYTVGQKMDDGSTGGVVYDPWQVAFAWSLGGLAVLLLIVGILLLGYLVAWVAVAYGAGSKKWQRRVGASA